MGSKFDVIPVIRDHYDTFEDRNAPERFLFRDYAGMVGIPAVAGGFIACIRVELREIGAYLSGVAVLTGLLFALVIFVFQLRLQIMTDERLSGPPARLRKLVDQLFANVNYAVVVGLGTSVAAVVAATTAGPDGGAQVWISAVLVALGTHLVLTVLMCVKRTRSAYRLLTR